MTDENTAPLASGATVADVPPEVTRFVGRVRQQLSDLEPETQDELLDGLVADLSDRVAEDGPGALGDPTAYAGELRAAAGLAPRARVRVPRIRGRGTARRGIGPRLDAAHATWDRLLARQSVLSPALLETLRPVWWVLRGLLLVASLTVVVGGFPFPPVGGPYGGLLVALVAALASVQIGRGLVWPGTSRATRARVAVLLVNLAAIAVIPLVLSAANSAAATRYVYYDNSTESSSGLTNDGSEVFNIFPYDAQGRPLTGVQLFDQNGHRMSASRWPDDSRYDDNGLLLYTFPWRNGDAKLYNVYPRPEQARDETDDSVKEPAEPALPTPPLARVPPATLPSSAPSPTAPAPSSSSSPSPSPRP